MFDSMKLILFSNKLTKTTSHKECVLDLFPLPRIELNIPFALTNKSLSPVNNDVPFIESNNEATQSEETLQIVTTKVNFKIYLKI